MGPTLFGRFIKLIYLIRKITKHLENTKEQTNLKQIYFILEIAIEGLKWIHSVTKKQSKDSKLAHTESTSHNS